MTSPAESAHDCPVPNNIRLALRSLNRNRLRTTLTMLGIIIGVAAVLTMVALGGGARAAVQNNVTSAGTISCMSERATTPAVVKVSVLRPAWVRQRRCSQPMRRPYTTILSASSIYLRRSIPAPLSPMASSANSRPSMASTPLSREKYAWEFKPGRMFTDKEVESGANVAVIGQSLADLLFAKGTVPVGGTITVRGTNFTVIGVTPGSGEEQTKELYLPWTTVQKSLSIQHLDGITVAAQRAGRHFRAWPMK